MRLIAITNEISFIARFIGANGSLGYQKNAEYVISTRIEKGQISVSREGGKGKCLYGSLRSLLNNWQPS
jgi:hypothetical protein